MSEKSGQPTTEKRPAARPKSNPRSRKGDPATKKAEPAKADTRPGESTDSAPGKRGGGGTALLATLILLVGAGAGAGGWYLWQAQQKTENGLAALEGRLQQDIEQLGARIGDRLDRRLGEAVSASQEGDRQLAAEVHALQQALSELRTRLGQNRAGWMAAEVEHLLRTANQRLRLARDVQGAIAALSEAEQRLSALGDPAYLPVREAVAKELQALQNLGATDREGAAVRLTGLIQVVDTLPVAGPLTSGQRPEAAAETVAHTPEEVADWRAFLGALWADIRSLVTIRQRDGAQGPLLAPEQRYFLYQNLRLKLETARLALLDGRPEVYRAALTEARQWLDTYFEQEAPATRGALATLDELERVTVRPELPDISGSLRTLNRVRDSLNQSQRPGSAKAEAKP